jgi:hypothetical protein
MLQAHKEVSYIDHKWEELVEKMCFSDDPELREKGLQEYNDIKLKNPAFKLRGIDRTKLN